MTKRLNIAEFASSLLDETIEKGHKLEERKLLKSKKERQELRKALSHNPFQPHDMTGESPYYNPYKFDETGTGWMPLPANEWYDMGKKPEIDNYLTTKQFYGEAGPQSMIDQTLNRFAQLRRSLTPDLIKAEPQTPKPSAGGNKAPIGTVHTYKDGNRYKKFAEGDWRPLAGLETGDMRDRLKSPQHGKNANETLESHHSYTQGLHKDIDTHAEKHMKISGHIKEKQKQEDTKSSVKKDTLGTLKTVLEKMNGGKLPPELEEHFNENSQSHLPPELAKKIQKKEAGKGHEISLSKQELTTLLKSGKYALISAGKNPKLEEGMEETAVAQRYEDLRGELKQGGYAFTKVKGHYGGEEDSFLVMVHDHDDDHMLELGKKFNQDSVIVADGGKQKMVYTTGSDEGQAHEGNGFKEVGEDQQDFYSEYPTSDGQVMKFALNFDFDTKSDHKDSADKKPEKKEAAGKKPESTGKTPAKKKTGVSWEDVANAYKSLFDGIEGDYLMKSDDLIKGGVPVGTVHIYTDGIKYKKITDNPSTWKPVSGAGVGARPTVAGGMSGGRREDHSEKVEAAIAEKLEKVQKKEEKKKKMESVNHEDVFNVEHPHSLVSVDQLKGAERQTEEKLRSKEKFRETLDGSYDKRAPLDVHKINNRDGSYHYAVGDGNTTFQMLKELGLKKFPVNIISEMDEKDWKPVGEHKRKEKKTIAPKDAGKPDNRMGPPPPENERFLKPGKDVTEDDVKAFIEKFKHDYVELQTLAHDLKAVGADNFGNRLKDVDSLLKKMNGRMQERSLNTVNDAIGTRALASSPDKQKAILKHIEDNYAVVERDDFSDSGRPDGYRAMHITFRSDNGKLVELQIKTHMQQIYSGYTHDNFYKPPKHLEDQFSKDTDGLMKNKEVAKYLQDVSNYLNELDKGGEDKPENRPKEPELLVKEKMMFPWEQVVKAKSGDLSDFTKEEDDKTADRVKKFERQERGKVKHFVVVRDENKAVKEIKEFNTFEDANKHLKKQKGDKSERVAGYSHSKEEFLQVFSEYRPEGWEA